MPAWRCLMASALLLAVHLVAVCEHRERLDSEQHLIWLGGELPNLIQKEQFFGRAKKRGYFHCVHIVIYAICMLALPVSHTQCQTIVNNFKWLQTSLPRTCIEFVSMLDIMTTVLQFRLCTPPAFTGESGGRRMLLGARTHRGGRTGRAPILLAYSLLQSMTYSNWQRLSICFFGGE